MSYRFSNIVGHSLILSRLKQSIEQNTLSHSYAFCGQQGIGKTLIAKTFAATLLCNNPINADACGECHSCLMLENNTHPDFYHIKSETESIGIEDVRAMQKGIAVSPLYSKKKVYVITEANKMTIQAQNCILKTLEEPPVNTIIIFTSTNYHSLANTIKSRLTMYKVSKNTSNEISVFLKNKYPSYSEIDFVTNYADGSIGKAIEFIECDEFKQIRDQTIDIVVNLAKLPIERIFEVYPFFETNRANINIVLDFMTMFYRDLLLFTKLKQNFCPINSDKKDLIQSLACKYTPNQLIKSIACIETTRKNIKLNSNFQINMEVMLIDLNEIVYTKS